LIATDQRLVPAAPRETRAEAALSRSTKVADFVDRNVFLILVFAVLGVFRLAAYGLGVGSDTWYTLLGGRIISSSWLPHRDALTVLGRGREWVDQQWLAHLLLYGGWKAGGWPLASLILLASFLGAFALMAASARRLGASAPSTAVVAGFCLMLAIAESSFRAQTLAYPLFAVVLLLLLEDAVRPTARVFVTLPLLALWANVHGSVVLGAALVCLRGLADIWERRAVTARGATLVLVPWLCTIASPYGFALPGYYLRLLHNPALSRFASEWQPATLTHQPLFFFVLAVATVLLLQRRDRRLFPQLAFLVTAVAALLAVRSIVWFALVAAAVVPRALDAVIPASTAPRRRVLNVAVGSVLMLALATAAAAYAAHPRSWFERGYTAKGGSALASAAAADPRALVFANERYADWLLFEHPELDSRIAYDVRFELLTQHQLRRVAGFRLEQGPDWLAVAGAYRLFVLDPVSDKGAISILRSRGARVLFADKDLVVLERRGS
jgi:hypothetical protein